MIWILISPIFGKSDLFERATKSFSKQINEFKFFRCEDIEVRDGHSVIKGCKEGHFVNETRCKTYKSNNNYIGHQDPAKRLSVRKFNHDNDMDPFPCHKMDAYASFPHDLTQIEEMLISLVTPVMSVYRLRHNIKYRGHCVTIPQDVNEVASKLPLLPSQAPCIIVRRSNHNAPNEYSHFRVRKNVIRRALYWLRDNN